MLTIRQIDPGEVRELIAELDAYQNTLYPAESNHLDSIDDLRRPNVCMIALFYQGSPVAIGAIKIFDHYGEIKRVYVPRHHRGKGYAKAIIEELERRLVAQGIATARLETGIKQHEAIALYRRYGYVQRDAFGPYAEDPLSLFMEKQLNSQPSARAVGAEVQSPACKPNEVLKRHSERESGQNRRSPDPEA